MTATSGGCRGCGGKLRPTRLVTETTRTAQSSTPVEAVLHNAPHLVTCDEHGHVGWAAGRLAAQALVRSHRRDLPHADPSARVTWSAR